MNQHINIESNIGRRGFLSFAGIGAAAAAMPAPAWALAADNYPSVRAVIEEYVSQKKVANILAAIGRGAAAPDVIAKGTLALNGSTSVDIDSIYRIYSMTKPITGMAAMMLIGEGKMKLDQPISDFLPEFKNMTVLVDPENSLEAVPAKNDITVRHLLTHTAGLGYTIITKGPLLKAYLENGITPGAISKMPIPGMPPSAPTPDLKTFSERLGKLPLIAEPGTKWSYSVSLDLLGRVIEVVSGMAFGAFLKTRIFEPLKMNSSYFQVPKSESPRFTTNYGILFGTLIPIDPANDSVYLDKPAFPSGGGGLACSARDYDRFLHMLMNFGELDGTRIMAPATAKLGMSNLLPDGIDTTGTFVDKAGHGAGGRVGLGKQTGSFGWGGAAGTSAFLHTGLKVRATGMTQYIPSNELGFQQDFPRLVLADILAEMNG